MSIFKREGGVMDAIRCDEPDYLIWKWRPNGGSEKTRKENAIRWGSVLTVKEGSLAVFVYKGSHDYVWGPFSEKLRTGNLPILAPLISLTYGGGSPFPAEVYFINLAEIVQVRFGVPFFDVFDPTYTEFSVPVAVRGAITFHISDYARFIELHRLDEFDLDRFKEQIRSAVNSYVKSVVLNAPEKYAVTVVQLQRKLPEMNVEIGALIKNRLETDFGVAVNATDISDIDIDTESDGYNELMRVTRNLTSASVRAQTEVNIRNIGDMQRIHAADYEESLRIKREEEQYAQHLGTQEQHINVHTLNRQTEVAKAAAEGLGSRSGGTGGIDPVGITAGMAVGSVLGKNVAGIVSGAMEQPPPPPVKQSVPQTPPPISQTVYYVAQNGVQTGPFDMQTLRTMAADGSLTPQMLVWCAGMAQWAEAQALSDLSLLFLQ